MSKTKFTIVIPARMSSTRLPGKMMLDVAGLPLIIRVAKQALKSEASQVVIATDHEDIFNECKAHNLNVVMTKVDHQSGTDRIAEVVNKLQMSNDEIIINVQGDEPLIDPVLINNLANFIATKKTSIATIAHKINSEDEIFNSNVVKVVLNNKANALYFSRAPIPYYRDGYNQATRQINQSLEVLRHIGIYAYQVSFLRAYENLAPCALEQMESLEQLRAMYYGYEISVMTTENAPIAGVDTAEDLVRVRSFLETQ
ncbi:MAG: 3-deoxy-manno-octulosonate cytidylyltransferase [Burkholderiales bacterium]|nr:3-deoxy-manno-octulosonate cytidylyltransferase [Burkholderiales bacterium]